MNSIKLAFSMIWPMVKKLSLARHRGLASMVYKFFDTKSSGSGITNESNYQLADELHKPIIRKFKKRKLYSSFRDNIWGVDLADMKSLSKYNKGIKYLLCAIDLFSKYAWVVPIKDKKRC